MDKNFNPRTHRGVRQTKTGFEFELDTFQSTHPSWGATFGGLKRKTLSMISIHAPIVGCDKTKTIYVGWVAEFQSTHPSWGATVLSIACLPCGSISIHAPIVGCD